MEWIRTDVDASGTGPIRATVEWMDPTREFLQALAMSALSKLPMPIPNDPTGYMGNGYVLQYAWTHELSGFSTFGGRTGAPRVHLTATFVILP